MSRGSNAGVLRAAAARDDEARSLEAFFEATREGMVADAALPGRAAGDRPAVAPRAGRSPRAATSSSTCTHRPCSWSTTSPSRRPSDCARCGVPYGDVVLGHPTALPVGDEVYGVPSAWPPAIGPDAVDLASLRAHRAERHRRLHPRLQRDAATPSRPRREPVDDAFAAHGEIVLYDYPAELHGPIRSAKLPRHAFLGSAVRQETADPDTMAWLARPDRGPSWSSRWAPSSRPAADVLARVAAALRQVDVRVAMAIGSNDRARTGRASERLARPPQPAAGDAAGAGLGAGDARRQQLGHRSPHLRRAHAGDALLDGPVRRRRRDRAQPRRHRARPQPRLAATHRRWGRGLLRNPPPCPAELGAVSEPTPDPRSPSRPCPRSRICGPSDSRRGSPRSSLSDRGVCSAPDRALHQPAAVVRD